MSLQTECPRCPAPVAPLPGGGWTCPEHGATHALRRPGEVSYDEFVEMLALVGDFPIHLPWPLSPGWSVSDFAVVGEQPARATMTCSSGTSALDGPVDVFLVSEESGVGLGARCAGAVDLDPGREVDTTPPAVRIRIGTQAVPLWPVSIPVGGAELDRAAFVGEAGGRWLWVVLAPAPAMLLLRDEWILRDVSGLGPTLVEMPFGGPRPAW